jgi:hypothetical protein
MRTQHVNDFRYKPNHYWSPLQATDILTRVQDPNHGVLSWLSTQP